MLLSIEYQWPCQDPPGSGKLPVSFGSNQFFWREGDRMAITGWAGNVQTIKTRQPPRNIYMDRDGKPQQWIARARFASGLARERTLLQPSNCRLLLADRQLAP